MKRLRSSIKEYLPYHRKCSRTIDCSSKYFLTFSRGYGILEFLPMDIRLHILSYLSVTELGIFSLVSKSTRALVEEFYSFRSLTHFPHETVLHTRLNDEAKNRRNQLYTEIGTMLKRLTCTYSTVTRINFVQNFLEQHICFASKKCTNHCHCSSLISFGYLLKSFTRGWIEIENQKLFHSLVHSCFDNNFWRKLTILTTSAPGVYTEDELCVRIFLRRLFIDPYTDKKSDVSYNLKLILKSWPIVQRARILFILYGPMNRGKLMWTAMCQSTAADGDQVRSCFGELGWAISTMHSTKHWSDDDAISVMDELISVPDDWLAENVACLLHTMGPSLAASVVISKAVNGRTSELAVTLTSMSLVAVKLRINLQPILLLVEKAYKATSTEKRRRSFLDHLSRAYQEVIIDLYEGDNIYNRIEDVSVLLKAQSFFIRALLGRVYEE